MSADLVMQLGVMAIGQALASAAIYGGIRADLRHAMSASEEAHRRIDAILGSNAINARNRANGH